MEAVAMGRPSATDLVKAIQDGTWPAPANLSELIRHHDEVTTEWAGELSRSLRDCKSLSDFKRAAKRWKATALECESPAASHELERLLNLQHKVPASYTIGDGGVFRLYEKASGEIGERLVSELPVAIEAVEHDEAGESLHVITRWRWADGGLHSVAIPAKALGVPNELARVCGDSQWATVTSTTASELGTYLESYRIANYGTIESRTLVKSFGWCNGILCIDNVRHGAKALKNIGAVQDGADPEVWKATCRKLLRRPGYAAAIAAAFGAPLRPFLGVDSSPVVELVGGTSTGKSSGGLFAWSLFAKVGDNGKLPLSFNSTAMQLIELGQACGDLLLVIDENSTADKRMNREQFVHQLVDGQERQRTGRSGQHLGDIGKPTMALTTANKSTETLVMKGCCLTTAPFPTSMRVPQTIY